MAQRDLFSQACWCARRSRRALVCLFVFSFPPHKVNPESYSCWLRALPPPLLPQTIVVAARLPLPTRNDLPTLGRGVSRLYPACMAERVASSSPTRADSGRMAGVALSSPSMSRGRAALVSVCRGEEGERLPDASVPFRSVPLRSVPRRAMPGAQSGQWLICQRE